MTHLVKTVKGLILYDKIMIQFLHQLRSQKSQVKIWKVEIKIQVIFVYSHLITFFTIFIFEIERFQNQHLVLKSCCPVSYGPQIYQSKGGNRLSHTIKVK